MWLLTDQGIEVFEPTVGPQEHLHTKRITKHLRFLPSVVRAKTALHFVGTEGAGFIMINDQIDLERSTTLAGGDGVSVHRIHCPATGDDLLVTLLCDRDTAFANIRKLYAMTSFGH